MQYPVSGAALTHIAAAKGVRREIQPPPRVRAPAPARADDVPIAAEPPAARTRPAAATG